MKKVISLITCLVLAFCMFAMTGCGSSEADNSSTESNSEVTVMAAASLTDALDEIIAEYEKDGDYKVLANYAGSGDLMQQIEGGAPADIFISASKSNMDQLEEENLIDASTRTDLLANALTLVASTEKADVVTMDSLTSDAVETISIGEIETVPAGKYASQVFDNLGITNDIQNKIVYGKDVRAVLNYVATGEVDCGFVYRTDAEIEKDNLAIIGDVSESLHDPIVYPAAILAEPVQADGAADFYEFMASDFSKSVFEKYGFTVK